MFQPTLHTYLWLSPLSVGGLSQFHTIIQYRKAHPTVVKALMSSGKSYSLVGVQDTDKAIRHTRLSADERKRLSSLANWKPQGHSVLQVGTADFLFSSALFWLLLRNHSI
jgi:hypothetical protein